jgi:hypothetical protein
MFSFCKGSIVDHVFGVGLTRKYVQGAEGSSSAELERAAELLGTYRASAAADDMLNHRAQSRTARIRNTLNPQPSPSYSSPASTSWRNGESPRKIRSEISKA